MNREQAIKVLEEYQKWRRYDGPIGEGPEMPSPSTIGEAIDYAIKILKAIDYAIKFLKKDDKERNR